MMAIESYQPGDNYTLPRDDAELNRLNIQQELLKKVLYDDRLVYDKTVTLDEGSRVLDSGTGSGAWILDLAKHVPEGVELYGIDVSSANFPKTHPPNVHLRIASATNLPPEWTDSFDFVHQRLLVMGLLASEWPKVISEFFRVLKPGGHIHLADMDYPALIAGSPQDRRWHDLYKRLMDKKGLMFDCSERLPALLEEAGFVDIVSEKKKVLIGNMHGQLGKIASGGARKGMRSAFILEGIVCSDAEYDEIMEDLEKEWAEAEGTNAYRMTTAHKPLS